MFFKKKGLPERGELVTCIVKKVLPHAVFVNLDEYENKEAMLHISEVSSRWVKNIKDFVSEGKMVVCKVLDIKREGHVDVSLKRVSAYEKQRKLTELKLEARVEKLIELIAKKLKEKPEQALKEIGEKIIETFDSLHEFFTYVKSQGVEAIDELEIPDKWKNELKTQISEQLKAVKIKIQKKVEFSSDEPDGATRLKKIFEEFKKLGSKIKLEIKYISAPNYLIEFTVQDYKKGEADFTEIFNKIQELAKKTNVNITLLEK